MWHFRAVTSCSTRAFGMRSGVVQLLGRYCSVRKKLATGMAVAVIGAAVAMATPAAAEPTNVASTVPAGTTVAPAIDCAPTAAHPYPVVVLPGGDGKTTETAAQWDLMVGALRDAGYCTLVFQGGIVDGTRWGGDIQIGRAHV